MTRPGGDAGKSPRGVYGPAVQKRGEEHGAAKEEWEKARTSGEGGCTAEQYRCAVWRSMVLGGPGRREGRHALGGA